jgi:hypothetical protein
MKYSLKTFCSVKKHEFKTSRAKINKQKKRIDRAQEFLRKNKSIER